MIATEIVDIEMKMDIGEIIIRTPNARVGIEINPLGIEIDHHLKAIIGIEGTTETPIPPIPQEGQQIETIKDHQDITQETINDHLEHPFTIAEVTLGRQEIEEDHQGPSLEVMIDQDLEDEITPVHTQEVVIDSIEGIDLPVGITTEDQVTTNLLETAEDTHLGQDHTPIQNIGHHLLGLPEIREHLLHDHIAEDIIMIVQD